MARRRRSYNPRQSPSTITSLSLTLPLPLLELDLDLYTSRPAINSPLLIRPELLQCLTFLHLSCNWAGSQIIDTVALCTNVETLELDFIGEDIPLAKDQALNPQSSISLFNHLQAGIHLPKLHTLRLLRLAGGVQIDFLLYLIAPQLITLDLSFHFDVDIEERPSCLPRGILSHWSLHHFFKRP